MYKNTQFAWVIWAILLWISSFLVVAAQLLGFNIGVVGFAGLLVLVAIAFYGLTVEVDQKKKTVSWWFGPGVGKKTLNFEEIDSVSAVRNSLRHGVGMRISNDGWVYSAAGFSAIEIALKDGMKYRIGTNDKDTLLSSFPEALRKQPEITPTPSDDDLDEESGAPVKKRKDPFDFH
ncbi:hypothetical protein [Pseudoalteromonas phenolica]|uniref:hypothetical protein n=1 Tax=Pseudoalteromonas phenolica TaxID=161398 RepID=UPI00207BB475|nr:hypothetical protein [Pseudoalteromonas phenolica]